MASPLTRTASFPEGYRITRAGGSLFIEVLADHPHPLRLRRDQLAGFGLRFEGGKQDRNGRSERLEPLLRARQVLFGAAILATALLVLLLVPAVLSGW
jgi:hypothetical protein